MTEREYDNPWEPTDEDSRGDYDQDLDRQSALDDL